MKLLLIEDSTRLQRSLKKGLQREGFAIDVTGDGKEGFAFATTYDYDAIILDIMLPGINGLEVLKMLRRKGNKTHVLILSAKDQVEDRIRGLEIGADDYLIKPFDFNELLARIRALVRRRYAQKQPTIELAQITVNTATGQVFISGEEAKLSPKEYHLLEYLLLRRGRVVTREALLEHLYAGFGDVGSNVIDVMVCNLRKKIKVGNEPPLIQTRRGFGYVIP